ncbi:MAG: flagellar hook-associated protein 2 [Nocardioidaceae bacterium]|nr:flagellar hook-associated protein 2 [Nocardioidaceae bacterium]
MASSTASIGGLVSGLDTSTIISQLMQVEAQPQTILKNRVSTEQTNISTLQALNAKFAALTTKATALAQQASWNPFTTTSSSTSVTASADSTALPGRYSFTVQQTATPSQLTFDTTAKPTDVVVPTSVVLTTATGPVTLDTKDGSLSGLVSAVNKANAGVTATTINLGDGTYRLRLVSASTGQASTFSLTDPSTGAAVSGWTPTAGLDAKLTVGQDTVTSSSNTFTGLSTGLNVTVAPGTAAGTAVDLTVARDATAAQSATQGLVDAANDILTTIDSMTAYNATTKASGALAGDATIRDLRSRVLDAVTRSVDGTSLADVGIQTDRDGKITFDTTKFATAYAADPGKVSTRLGAPSTATSPGFAARLSAVGTAASDSTRGVLTTDIQGRQSSVTTWQNSIADWDVKLSAKEEALNKQYADLEVALGKLKDQSTWLSGQLASLSGSSSSSS